MIIQQTRTNIIPIAAAPQFIDVTVHYIDEVFDRVTGKMTFSFKSRKAAINMAFVSALVPKTLEAGTVQFNRNESHWFERKSDLNNVYWYSTHENRTNLKNKKTKKVLAVTRVHHDLDLNGIRYITIDK